MPDNNRFEEEQVNYSDLIFDWGNPSAPVKKTVRKPAQASPAETVKKTEETVRIEEEPAGRAAVPVRENDSRQKAVRENGRGKSAGAAAAARLMGRKEQGSTPERKIRMPERKAKPDAAARGGAEKENKKTRSGELLARSKKRALRNRLICAVCLVAVLALVIFLILQAVVVVKKGIGRSVPEDLSELMEEDYLTVNSYSRPGISTHKLTGIVIHNTAEPGVTAKERRDYYEGLAESHAARASVNYIVGLEGEVIVCVPPGEVAYASNDRNLDTISVEYCHADESGAVSEETYRSMVELIRQLCEKYSIAPENVIRHYDVTGKLCPKYYVEDQAAWEKLLSDIKG